MAEKPYWNSPMDFAEPQTSTFDQLSQLSSLCGPHKYPLRRIPNDRNPRLSSFHQRAAYAFMVICLSTSSFLAWHFKFPTTQEKLIWRVACIVAQASLSVHAVAEAVGYHNIKRQHSCTYVEDYKTRWLLDLLFLRSCYPLLLCALTFGRGGNFQFGLTATRFL